MSRLDRTCNVADCAAPVWAREMCRKHYMRWHQHGDPSITLRRGTPTGAPAAFLAALPSEGEGCIRWPFSTNNMGYAQINNRDTGKVLVTRLVCERVNGPPPSPTHHAAHTCGKGHEACIAPWHLLWKTPAENAADLSTHGTRLRGEQAPWSKLTDDQARAIFASRGLEPQGVVGDRYGVTQTMVSRIWRGKAWAHIAREAA